MNNNSNKTITEPIICKGCMTFYANPKLGNFCSKCFSEQDKQEKKIKEDKSKDNDLKEKDVPPPISDVKSEIPKETRPVQVY